MSLVEDAPVQPSLRRMQRFGVRPDRELGQNFLIDSNILGVIERAADLSAEDVVLEIGGGLGVLSEHLAERARHVHVVEIDERLKEALLDATDGHANVSVHWGDAMRIELTKFDPAPTKVIANLPYGIAAGVLLRTVAELPTVESWVGMAQREVGERLAAGPGSGAYGTPSVLAQLECEVEVLRAIPRSVFLPVPNVDSVLVGMRRHPRSEPGEGETTSAALRGLVSGGFAHRRKTLSGSLGLSGGAPGRSREQIRSALQQLGHPPDARAERLSPADFRALAPAKINLGLFLGPTRAEDGKHELVSVMQSISLADELTLEPGPPGTDTDEVLCPGVEGAPAENLAARALAAFRARTGWEGPPLRLSILKRIPVAAGLGGGSADAAASLRLAREASGLGSERLLLEIAAELGADVPAQIAPGRWLATGAGEHLQALPSPRAPFGVLVLPSVSALSTGEVYREADRLGLSRPAEELEIRRLELYEALEHGEGLPAATELLHNDLQRAAVSLQPKLLEALRRARGMGAEVELLSGSGPTVLGLFRKAEQAQHAARALEGLTPAAIHARPVEAAFGLARASQSPTVNL